MRARLRLRDLVLSAAAGWLAAGAVLARPAADPPALHHVPRTASEIHIDGRVVEPAWDEALALELEYEVRPGENIPPPVRTTLLITYDDAHVYFAFRAYDPEPGRIRARYSDRDQAWEDDWVGVVLDTFNDERRAYELISNPLGVQIDALNDDLGGEYDTTWNAIWESKGRITDFGYEVEIAVPFHQIRFRAEEGAQTWGFDAMRSYPRGDRHHIGLFARDRGSNSYLGQTVKLVGWEDVSPGRNLEIVPTVVATRSERRDEIEDESLELDDQGAELGVSARWGVTPDVSLNAALNPDFSQVEADVLRLDINEQFALFFPETRPFFLEGSDYFNTPLGLVYTRNVADPRGALKVTGKKGRHTFGVFGARDELTNMIFPGPESSSAGSYGLETTASVGRYRYDFGRSSTVGGTLTDRRGGRYHNAVLSADALVRFTETDQLVVSLATSDTLYSEEMVRDQELEEDLHEDPFRGDALFAEYLHTTRGWWTRAEYQSVGEGFRADMGFLPQVDREVAAIGGARVWWGDGDTFYNRMAWGAEIDRSRRQNGEPLEEEIESWWNMSGPLESYIWVNTGIRDRWVEGESFQDMFFLHAGFEMRPSRDVGLSFEGGRGDWIDFTNLQPAERTIAEPSVELTLGRHVLLRYRHFYQALDVEGGRLFRAHAPEARLIYQFNGRAFVRLILQYTDIRRDPDLYEEEVDAELRDFFSQFLFTYKVNPQTALYVGYSDDQVGNEEAPLTPVSRSLFVKVGYAWVP